ncbi:hypothetical protein N7475_007739 [Penicillium sp. IBT 31633x]|nr:hypothetical protein N7475_007739 [Penicillium sp. IBT 31633x]
MHRWLRKLQKTLSHSKVREDIGFRVKPTPII